MAPMAAPHHLLVDGEEFRFVLLHESESLRPILRRKLFANHFELGRLSRVGLLHGDVDHAGLFATGLGLVDLLAISLDLAAAC